MKRIIDFLTRRDGNRACDLTFLLLVFGGAFLQFLGRIPLIEPDEGRYAEVSREMLELGDFITPHLNYVKYFAKPPLHYWLDALSFTVFGQNEFAARFPGAVMGLMTVLLTYLVGRSLFGRREGLLAALILGTSTGFLVQARINFIDMTLTCTLSAALAFFILAAREGESRKGLYYHLFYIFAALAVLAKGLIGIVFPGAVIFLYILFTGNWKLMKEMRLLTGIPLFLMACAPWFILVSIKNPEFPAYFFIEEHFSRFTSAIHHHREGVWFFIPVLLGTMLPWSFFIPASLRGVWSDRRSPEGAVRLYLTVWAVFIFIFFSISKSQLIPYILPVVPPLALLMGCAYARISFVGSRLLKIQCYSVASVLTIGGAGIIFYPHFASHPGFSATCAAVVGGILLMEGIMSFRNTLHGSILPIFTVFLLCSYIVCIAATNFLLPDLTEKRSYKEMGLIVREKAGKDGIIASFGLRQGLSFYSGRRVLIVGDRGEAEFGSRQGDQSPWFYDLKRFAMLWDSSTPVFTLLTREELKYLQGLARTTPRIISQNGKRILITNNSAEGKRRF
ncbi:MAG TPA: glycosyltransferase family 39 protein [Geobacteraceae bacterium]|nr:glycosyltransferase family 39 protein [Geobacteraceae bacterium]